VQGLIPQVPYSIVLTDMLLGSLMFAVAAMAEYSILNFCSTSYNKMRIKINQLVEEIENFKNRSKELKLLDQLREETRIATSGNEEEGDSEEGED